ncbi:hypothetical protein KIMH_02660 [Bombiscardovia apis]|uniref:DUF1109 domain-containing protein n=1 Tax=Bombiscardovia apis TaxID=2932182 RepID=A0ABN6SHQ0_9BIFI|nr:hypothetical protein [Bombiscardovia apis]BDR54155.1 hypothetical protein KIMH_02660 [Bombiscardovia apis]
MKNARRVDYGLALCACVAAGLDMLRAVNPTYVMVHLHWMERIPRYWVTGVFAGATLLFACGLYIVARRRARGGFVSSRTALAGIAALLALAVSASSYAVALNNPRGLFGVQIQKAPLQHSDTAQQVISSALGECKQGWVELGESDISGLSFGVVCSSLKTAYAEFETPEAATNFKSAMKTNGPLLMRNYDSATWQPKATQYDGLSGQVWIAITPKQTSAQLNSVIGGRVERLY